MRQIMVEVAQVETCANKIEEMANLYKQAYNQLFDEVDLMKTSWNGKDNQAFSTQIAGYEDDFNQLHVLIWQYIEFLRASAKAYKQLQDELASQAQALAN
ncbi:MAG: WXG100 family type VII secretion target [Erysipelotrichaceae bacterium]|nr:WXG100 family type VII secretion target [Erysipelotrichaceae bacterium]MDY5251333.1 WXG100 family type VII secretion target [Erysipelotrichaceae bacterium]